ncbi:MAG: hypothetical protein U5L76_01205 [Patescibacteria group bacterium]|nr:hypothetical protein [Patescibacteria group bacterium]
MNKFILVIIIIIIGVGIWWWQQSANTVITNTGWLTYENRDYNFELQYPNDWTPQESSYDDINTEENKWEPKYWEDWKVVKKISFNTSVEFFYLDVYIMDQSIESVLDKVGKNHSNSPFQPSLEEIKINANQAYVTSVCDLGCCSKDVYIAKDENTTIQIARGAVCSVGSEENIQKAENNTNTFEQILTTFKFAK